VESKAVVDDVEEQGKTKSTGKRSHGCVALARDRGERLKNLDLTCKLVWHLFIISFVSSLIKGKLLERIK